MPGGGGRGIPLFEYDSSPSKLMIAGGTFLQLGLVSAVPESRSRRGAELTKGTLRNLGLYDESNYNRRSSSAVFPQT